MTVSSSNGMHPPNPNYKACWMCDWDVDITGGTFCPEFDTYCCIRHVKDLNGMHPPNRGIITDRDEAHSPPHHCAVCECEGVKTSHQVVYQPQNGWFTGNGA
jgi:hypothetical protein